MLRLHSLQRGGISERDDEAERKAKMGYRELCKQLSPTQFALASRNRWVCLICSAVTAECSSGMKRAFDRLVTVKRLRLAKPLLLHWREVDAPSLIWR